MRIAFVVTGLLAQRFTGGMRAVLIYANGLVERGHDVSIVPAGFAERPEWFDLKARIHAPPEPPLPIAFARAATTVAGYKLGRRSYDDVAAAVARPARQLAFRSTWPLQRGADLERLRRIMPPADVTVATAFPTALPVHLYGHGAGVYFAQHDESITAPHDFDDPELARGEARLSFSLPLQRIVNSSWLQTRLREHYGADSEPCLNAVAHDEFFPDGRPAPGAPFTVVSYGGRDAEWKGFDAAAEAIALARAELGEVRWLVYGGARLPPDNPIAPYEDRGFLTGAALRRFYGEGHVLLAPSWYESFPLFPLEAMACGVAVVTTPYGTEDYARDEETALVVPPRDPRAMAAALVRLARDPEGRAALAERGRAAAGDFTWERSVERMDALLRAAAASGPAGP
jgi:glycosyltransferase involved in cell wall biosynthesis